jgi:hypothetical protein
LESCSGKELATNIDVFALQKLYELQSGNNDELDFIPDDVMEEMVKIENTILDTDKGKYLDYSIRFFEIEPKFTMNRFLGYFVLTNLIIFSLAEILKRAFYYIVLGTLKPKK